MQSHILILNSLSLPRKIINTDFDCAFMIVGVSMIQVIFQSLQENKPWRDSESPLKMGHKVKSSVVNLWQLIVESKIDYFIM